MFTVGKGVRGERMEFDSKMAVGLFVVFCALLCDGIYGPYQNKIKTKARPRQPIVVHDHLFGALAATSTDILIPCVRMPCSTPVFDCAGGRRCALVGRFVHVLFSPFVSLRAMFTSLFVCLSACLSCTSLFLCLSIVQCVF